MESNLEPNPKSPPDDVLRAYSPRPAVRRLNRAALAIIFLGVALLFAGRTILGLFERYAAQMADDERERVHLRATQDMAERGVMSNLPTGYGFMVQHPAPPPPEPPKEIEKEEPPPIDPNILKQLEALRLEQERALNSPIQFPDAHPLAPKSPSRIDADPQNDQPIAGSSPGVAPDGHELHYDAQRRNFFRDAAAMEQSYTRSRLLPPRSRYEIKAGTIIPAALITPINTDLPGDVVGHVTTNLFDSVTGHVLLVPQGSRLIGRYDSEVHKGQNRALIAWQRLILPNGHSIVLEAMPGTDAQGVAGMAGQVDWHGKRLAGATLLSTLIALGGNYAANIKPEEKELSIVGQTVAQDASRVGQRVIDRELDLRPTITVPEGTPFNVLVTKDLELAPYKPVISGR